MAGQVSGFELSLEILGSFYVFCRYECFGSACYTVRDRAGLARQVYIRLCKHLEMQHHIQHHQTS